MILGLELVHGHDQIRFLCVCVLIKIFKEFICGLADILVDTNTIPLLIPRIKILIKVLMPKFRK